jgi:mono/diheme cytochrome c family protein
MQIPKAAAFVLAVMIASTAGLADDAPPIACDDAAVNAQSAEAFNAYCARCHKAKEVAGGWFGAGQDAAARERELATFLDRHSACPHRHHEDIATWLRQLSGNP